MARVAATNPVAGRAVAVTPRAGSVTRLPARSIPTARESASAAGGSAGPGRRAGPSSKPALPTSNAAVWVASTVASAARPVSRATPAQIAAAIHRPRPASASSACRTSALGRTGGAIPAGIAPPRMPRRPTEPKAPPPVHRPPASTPAQITCATDRPCRGWPRRPPPASRAGSCPRSPVPSPACPAA